MSEDIKDYAMKGCDTQKERRNFPGYEKKQYYTMEQLVEGDTDGMTETDSKTSGKDDGKYTKINQTSGKVR